jgi:SAM-dependent methyltransferase
VALKQILANPKLYRLARQVATGGLPLRRWADLCGLGDPALRVADIGCGPCDILDYLPRGGRPAFYLGIDFSQAYLEAARARAAAVGVPGEFLMMDLARLPGDAALQQELVGLLELRRISRVLLLGVLHHIDDRSAVTTLDTVRRAACVESVVTVDVLHIPGRWINNWFCGRDRGEFVRDEAGYDALLAGTGWTQREKVWTTPGLRSIKYLHYILRK